MAWDNTTENSNSNYMKLAGQTINPSSTAAWICGFVRDDTSTANFLGRAILSFCSNDETTRNWFALFKNDADDTPYTEFLNPGGSPTANYVGQPTPPTIVTAGWDKFLVQWNGDGSMTYFRNGTKYNTTSGITAGSVNWDEIVIGSAYQDDSNAYRGYAFYGQICYVCVGTTALSDAEAQEMTAGTYKPWTVAPAKVLHAWPLISNGTAAVGSNLSNGPTAPTWSADDPGLADYPASSSYPQNRRLLLGIG